MHSSKKKTAFFHISIRTDCNRIGEDLLHSEVSEESTASTFKLLVQAAET
jgi:hypothetical protein